MATLTIDHEKVCYLIIKAREFDAKMEAEVPEPGDNPADDAEREILFDYPDDPTVEEIRGFLGSLNEDEMIELLALMWVGSGDYDIDEWDDALNDARDDADSRRPDALLGMPLLGDFLDEGLAQFGISCADVELGRL
jgi:hypothetical protein